MDNFLQLQNVDEETDNTIFDDVEIIVDPELEDESTVDINNYLNKFILQCRICGNMFPSEELLNDEEQCPICDMSSPNGFIYKGKLLNKSKNMDVPEDTEDAIQDLLKDAEELKQNNNDDEINTTDTLDDF